MNLQRKVDIQAFLDEQRFSRFHILLFVLCFLIIALDGMDTGATPPTTSTPCQPKRGISQAVIRPPSPLPAAKPTSIALTTVPRIRVGA